MLKIRSVLLVPMVTVFGIVVFGAVTGRNDRRQKRGRVKLGISEQGT